MGCGCSAADSRRGHTLWTCQVCGSLVAEGCVDVGRWHSVHVPAGLPQDMRWSVPEVT